MLVVGEDNNGGVRLYRNTGDRRKAVAMLQKDGYRCFTGFESGHRTHPAGLNYNAAKWTTLVPFVQSV